MAFVKITKEKYDEVDKEIRYLRKRNKELEAYLKSKISKEQSLEAKVEELKNELNELGYMGKVAESVADDRYNQINNLEAEIQRLQGELEKANDENANLSNILNKIPKDTGKHTPPKGMTTLETVKQLTEKVEILAKALDEQKELEKESRRIFEKIEQLKADDRVYKVWSEKADKEEFEKFRKETNTKITKINKNLRKRIYSLDTEIKKRLSVQELDVTNVKDEPNIDKEGIGFDWSILPSPHNRYIAMDESCYWYAYSKRPSIVEDVWDANLDHIWNMPKRFYPKGFKGNWKDSLFENPKYATNHATDPGQTD